MDHSPRFLELCEAARTRVREVSAEEVRAALDRGDPCLLVDVREESEWAVDHLPGAIHIGRGVLERDVEVRIPDAAAPVIVYCGGGYRSALAAESLGRMGYSNVRSMAGGIRGWRERGFPVVSR